MLRYIKSNPLDIYKKKLRLDLLDLIYKNGGHIGGALSAIDIITAVYYSNIYDFNKDHFVLSAGHLATAYYVVLASLKKFPKNLLSTYGQFGSILQGHISTETPGVEYSSGSLGQGLSFAAGLALGDRKHKTICLTSDGEQQEGNIWETLSFASKYKLGNLINIVNYNGVQIDGTLDEIMPLRNLARKYVEFGWSVIHVNGHSFTNIIKALKNIGPSDYPTCIIANTVIGKGISYMENNHKYHDVKNLSEELYEKARLELK